MEEKGDQVQDAWDILNIANSRFPEVLAVVNMASQVSETAFTYSSLHNSSSRLANFLRASGVRRADRVAVCLPNSRECLEIHFACAALHAILVNLNTSLVARELAHILSVSSPRCIIAHTRLQRPLCEAVLQLTHSGGQVIDQPKGLVADSYLGNLGGLLSLSDLTASRFVSFFKWQQEKCSQRAQCDACSSRVLGEPLIGPEAPRCIRSITTLHIPSSFILTSHRLANAEQCTAHDVIDTVSAAGSVNVQKHA